MLIEEFGFINPLEPAQVNAFFRLMDDRCNRKSTMITSNLGFDEWEKFLGGNALVAALVSRLLQNCKTIMFPKQALKLRNPTLGLPARAERPAILNAEQPLYNLINLRDVLVAKNRVDVGKASEPAPWSAPLLAPAVPLAC